MTQARPETRARAVLALLDPWIRRVEAGPSPGDIDLTRARRHLASLVCGVRAVAGLRPLPTLRGPVSGANAIRARHAAIDALLTCARSAGVDGIEAEQVEAKTVEIARTEDAALAESTKFMCSLLESLPRRPFRRGPRRVEKVTPPDGAAADPLTPDQARALTDAALCEAAE